MHYFAYGSNMSSLRIKRRVPSTVVKTIGTLPGYTLKFNKVSSDKLENRSGKGHIENTSNQDDLVHGVVYEINESEKDKIDDSLKPYSWYIDYVIAGARENNLPKDYIKKLEAVESIEDPNPELHDT